MMRFHILGAGAIGCHIATELVKYHPVTLLLRSQRHLDEFKELKNTITIRRFGSEETHRYGGFDAVVMGSDVSHIDTLVVTTKAHHTVSAIASIASQLTEKSTLVLLQNGVGVVDELFEQLWSNSPAPTIIVGVNRHAVERLSPFNVIHNSGWNDVNPFLLAVLPGGSEQQAKLVLEALVAIPDGLQAKVLPWDALQLNILKKLVINAAINPIAAMLECKNGRVLASPSAVVIMRHIVEEANQVLDELDISDDDLFDIVMEICNLATNNSCSMVQDVRSKQATEIDYINGYIVKRSEKGIKVPVNETMVNLIRAKTLLWK